MSKKKIKSYNRLSDKNSDFISVFKVKTPKQQDLLESIRDNEITISIGVAGSGKAQPLYSKIYTPNGHITMGDAKIGMEICTPDGKTAQITNIYPQGLKDYYKIYFTDGTSVDCCAEHLWKVYTVNDRRSSKDRFSILSTKEMIGSVITKQGRKNYKMPITNPVYYIKKDLPLDPYLVGLLLGDGGMTTRSTILSSIDIEIIESAKSLVHHLDIELIHHSNCDYRFRINKEKTNSRVHKLNRITGELGIRCKSEYKFIPEMYKYSSVEDRIAMLQGLMDTDGTVDKKGFGVTFSTSSKRLSDDFTELVRSIGGVASTNIKKTTHLDSYRSSVNLPPEICPFRLLRKKDRIVPKTKYKTAKFITNIEYIGQTEQQCISIDSKEHLYITDHHIVTHNTITTLAASLSLLGSIYKKIILVKSVVTIPGESIGFLPGGTDDKMKPFIMSYTWNIDKLLEKGSAKGLLDNKTIEVLPLAYIRGLSIDKSIVIVDEAQNLDPHTFKTIITRIGYDSKYIFLGDIEQVDRKGASSLSKVWDIFKESDLIGTVEFKDSDCVRNPIIPKILKQLREHNI